jgi:hypothetical protein
MFCGPSEIIMRKVQVFATATRLVRNIFYYFPSS